MADNREARRTAASRRINFWLAAVWLAVVPIAWIFGWYYSVAFIAAASIYANFASHVAAWRSDANPNEKQLERLEAQLEELLTQNDHISRRLADPTR